MKRVLSQRIMCSASSIMLNTIIEIDVDGFVTVLLPLSEYNSEIQGTLFYNGIISPGVVSLSARVPADEIRRIEKEFNYINFGSNCSSSFVEKNNKPLIIDCNSENIDTVNEILSKNQELLRKINIVDLINALVFHPAKAISFDNEIKPGLKTDLLLWPSPESLAISDLGLIRLKQI